MADWFGNVERNDILADKVYTLAGVVLANTDTLGVPGTGFNLADFILGSQAGPELRTIPYGGYVERVDVFTTATAGTPTAGTGTLDVYAETATGTFTKITAAAGIAPSVNVKSATLASTGRVTTYITAANMQKIIPNGRIIVTPKAATDQGSITMTITVYVNRAVAAQSV